MGENVIGTTKISLNQVNFISSQPEGQRLDLKSKRIAPAKLSRSLSAFANSDGGELFVGLEDDRTWDGFETEEDANGILDVVSQIFPLADFVQVEFLAADARQGLVLKISIARTPDIKRSSDDKVYVRFGAQNLKKEDAQSLRQLEYAKGVFSFEDQTIQGSLDEVENSVSIIHFSLNIIPTPEPKTWLRKQKLIVNEKATVAANVLFADEPQVNLPKSGIKVYRYKTAAANGTRDTLAFDPIAIEGNCYALIEKTVSITKEVAQDVPKLGVAGLEKILYPAEAIHEIITNAVIHRDYSVNDEIHIRIFDNRIEIFSPGRLPGYVTPQNILQERFARNPKIVRILNKFPNPPNKDVGEGLNTAFEKMRELKLRDPIVQETDTGVMVILVHELLASPEEIIKGYLMEHGQINNSTAREICREGSENKIKRIFERMMDANIIEKVPDRRGRATAYQLRPHQITGDQQ